MAAVGRGQVLIPWPNRHPGRRATSSTGTRHQLPLTEPEARNAIHGLVRWVAVDGRRARGRSRRAGAHASSAAGLSVRARARHRVRALGGGPAVTHDGDERRPRRVPVRERPHPYLTSAPRRWTRSSCARRGERCCTPTSAGSRSARSRSRAPSTTSGGRGRSARRARQRFTDLERDDDGRARVELRDPDDGAAAHALGRRELPVPELFTGDPLPTSTGAASPSSR